MLGVSHRGEGGVSRGVSWITRYVLDSNYSELMDRGKRNPRTCDHEGPALIRPTGAGLAALCLVCDTLGPERDTAEEARQALRSLAEGRRGE